MTPGTVDELRLKMASDPAFARQITEDCASLLESARFMVRWRDGSPSITCECCGITVALADEASCYDGPGRRFRSAIWEPTNGRKHTQRRCDWIRENGEPACAT